MIDQSINSIIFDFDGVLVESNEIRTDGFRILLERHKFSPAAINGLITFHRANGGLSRYYKLRYFFENILKRGIGEDELNELCEEFSSLVKQDVIGAPWVKGALDFLEENFSKFTFYVVSGSDQTELREICRARKIDHFFNDILGSPTDKKTNLKQLLAKNDLTPEKTLFVGDAVNDWEAASAFNLQFIMRDSGHCDQLREKVSVIRDLSELIPGQYSMENYLNLKVNGR